MSGSLDLGSIHASLELRTGGLTKGIRESERELAGFGSRARGVLDSLSRDIGNRMSLAGAGLAAGLAAATKAAASFDQAMRNTNSIAKLNEEQFQSLSKSVAKLSDDPNIRQGPTDLAKGLYDVYSSGKEGAEALDVLRVAAIGAGAGMTDTATSSRGLLAVLNSGIPGVKTAKDAMDVLFKTVDRGVITFPELASSIGQVLPIAAKAGISLQQVGAYIAVATKQGQSGAEAINDLNNLITKLIRPSDQAAKMMDQLGISHGLTALKAKGLSGVLAELTEKTRGQDDVLAQLFPDMQAFRALLAAGKDEGAAYKAELNAMAQATEGLGATQKAANEQAKGAEAQYQKVKAEVEKLSIEIGQHFLPVLRDSLKHVKEGVEWFSKLPDPVKQSAIEMGALAAGVLLVGGRVVSLTRGVVDLIAKLREASAIPLLARFVGPLAPAAAGAAALVGIGNLGQSKEDRLKQIAQGQAAGSTIEGLQKRIAANNAAIRTANSGTNVAALRAENARLAQQLVGLQASNTPPPSMTGAKIPGAPGPAIVTEEMKKRIDAQREASIELLRISDDAKKKRIAAEMEADDEYKRLRNEEGVSEVTAFGIRKERYRAAAEEFNNTIAEARRKSTEEEQKTLRAMTDILKQRDAVMQGAADDIGRARAAGEDFANAFRLGFENNAIMGTGANAVTADDLPKNLADALDAEDNRRQLEDVGRDLGEVFRKGFEDASAMGAEAIRAGDKDPLAGLGAGLKDPKTTRELRESFRNSFGGGLLEDLGYELGTDLFHGMEKAFGNNPLGRALSRSLARVFDKAMDGILDSLVSGLFKGKSGGIGTDMGPGKKMDIGQMLLGSLVGLGVGAAAGGLFKGIGKLFHFAEGGFPPVGVPSIVGEKGPELFVPSVSGMIVPNHQLAAAGAGGAGGISINVHMPGMVVSRDMDVDRLTHRMTRALADKLSEHWYYQGKVRQGSG